MMSHEAKVVVGILYKIGEHKMSGGADGEADAALFYDALLGWETGSQFDGATGGGDVPTKSSK